MCVREGSRRLLQMFTLHSYSKYMTGEMELIYVYKYTGVLPYPQGFCVCPPPPQIQKPQIQGNPM